MCEIEENIINKCNKYTCFACLSCDRNVNRIDNSSQVTDILEIICHNIYKLSHQQLYLCWECDAVLKRILLFKSQIAKAQRILVQNVSQKKKTIVTLSRLSIQNTSNIICITHNDNKISDVKQETVENDDNFCYDVALSKNLCIEEIKTETKPKIKHLKNKKSHYRFVYGPNIFKKSTLRKRFSIKRETIFKWLERERNSSFFSAFKYKCNMCLHGFNSEEKLKKHNLKRHDKLLGEYICTVCNQRFATQAELSAHNITHEFAYECAQCSYKSYSVRHINTHINTHRLIQCIYCDVCLPDINTFKIHYKTLHHVFICDHCAKRCSTKCILEKHIRSVHVTSHWCGYAACSRRYRSLRALRKHARTHVTSPPELAYCVHCDKQYANVHLYRQHVLTAAAHNRDTKQIAKERVPCPECDNTYSRRTYMMNHYRYVHAKQSKYFCQHCHRPFLNRTKFVEHMRYNHEGKQKLKNKLCNICGKGFSTNRILLNHIRTHTGEKPFQCDHCSAKFTQKHSMLSHVKYIHLKNKRRATWQH